MCYVYLVRCRDNSLYCGSTNDVLKRVDKHNSSKGAKYTRSRLPVELVYFSTWPSKSAALSYEDFLKKQTKEYKEYIVVSAIVNEYLWESAYILLRKD